MSFFNFSWCHLFKTLDDIERIKENSERRKKLNNLAKNLGFLHHDKPPTDDREENNLKIQIKTEIDRGRNHLISLIVVIAAVITALATSLALFK